MGAPVMAPEGAPGKPLLTSAVSALGQETLEPTAFLAPSADLASTVRSAAKDLFDFTAGYVTDAFPDGKTPLPELHADGFDAEQIWLQLEMQSEPVLKKIRKKIRQVVRKAEDEGAEALIAVPEEGNGADDAGVMSDDDEGPRFDSEDFSEEGGSEENEDFEDEDFEDEDDLVEDRKTSNGKAGVSGKKNPVEDAFLSLEDMEKFLQDAEERDEQEGAQEEEEDLEGEEDEGIKYEDFYGRKEGKKKPKRREEDEWGGEAFSEEDEMEEGGNEGDVSEEEEDEAEEDADGGGIAEGLSAHERRLARTKDRIAQLEKANVEEKKWTMAGEATASKRPLNSALEVDLDFDHAQRPAPVITEEVTASLEDIIKKRIIEGQFDDVEKKAPPANAAPKRREELDESKSQKGLAEIYEEEYVRATAGPDAVAAASGTDLVKREAAMLFKSLCHKLDALSHFTFAPKPVIEDASVRADVPALAMEEVAPLAVSDANLLAPEEVFAGGDGNAGVRGKAAGAVKADAELTQEERKSRRAKKKRKRKAEQAEVEKDKRAKLAARAGGVSNSEIAAAFAAKTATKPSKGKTKGQDGGQPKQAFTKSAQVFARIQEAQDEAAASKGQKKGRAPGKVEQNEKHKQSFKL